MILDRKSLEFSIAHFLFQIVHGYYFNNYLFYHTVAASADVDGLRHRANIRSSSGGCFIEVPNTVCVFLLWHTREVNPGFLPLTLSVEFKPKASLSHIISSYSRSESSGLWITIGLLAAFKSLTWSW